MKNFLQRANSEQSGQVMLIVLAVLLMGSLSIAPVLSFASTGIASNNNMETGTKGIYAAEAGIENVIWSLEHNMQTPLSLGEEINGMSVNMTTEDLGDYTLFFGMLVPVNGHNDYLSVSSGIEWDESVQAYKYTVTVTKQITPSTIFINMVGTRLPAGYHYVPDSASLFTTNFSQVEPDISQDSQSAEMVNWTLPNVMINDEGTQVFYITGEGELDGDYSWVVANRSDVGEVSEISGGIYNIIATATSTTDNKIKAVINTKIMMVRGTAEVITWQITK